MFSWEVNIVLKLIYFCLEFRVNLQEKLRFFNYNHKNFRHVLGLSLIDFVLFFKVSDHLAPCNDNDRDHVTETS